MTPPSNEVKNSAQPRWTLWYQHAAARVFQASGAIRRKVVNAGDLADYTGWLKEHFGSTKVLREREQVWERMCVQVTSGPVVGLEFGVAWGYATDWWMTHLPNTDLEWHAFDRFTGLPRSWRNLDAGAFGNDGNPPPVNDARVTWHVGDVEATIGKAPLDRARDSQVIVLFDLDLYEPSKVAWDHLKSALKPGDLLYFDESFDTDERQLLDESVLPEGRYTCVGATPLALALRVEEISAN